MMDSADPLEGWSLKEIRRESYPAKNDIYGGLFKYVHRVLLEFCHRFEKLQVSFQLFHRDALELPGIIDELEDHSRRFDRIEVRKIHHSSFPKLTILAGLEYQRYNLPWPCKNSWNFRSTPEKQSSKPSSYPIDLVHECCPRHVYTRWQRHWKLGWDLGSS